MPTYGLTAADKCRKIADTLDMLPDFPEHTVTCNVGAAPAVAIHGLTKDELVVLVRGLGRVAKNASGGTFWVNGDYDGVDVTGFAADREDLCRRVVTGRRTVPAQAERVEDIVEWVCDPILGTPVVGA